ncbi:MAG: acyltransferase family protein [Acutalibacteraceae bacterium]|jgi:surface polysaccharide O-acyltransferase-like enzyme
MGRKRIAWLDYARSIAIVCVCICHSTEIFYHGVLIGESDVTNALWFLLNSLYTFGRIGVPLFLMLTGALMLGKDIAPNVFYKK